MNTVTVLKFAPWIIGACVLAIVALLLTAAVLCRIAVGKRNHERCNCGWCQESLEPPESF